MIDSSLKKKTIGVLGEKKKIIPLLMDYFLVVTKAAMLKVTVTVGGC